MTSASWRRRAVVLAVAAGLSVLGGCASATPLCDQAAVLAEVGALGRATESYALASRAGEGKCADSGLTAAGARYADAYTDVVQGRAEESTRNLDGAVAAYRAALAVDDSNASARDGLARLGQPVPAFREPQPVPPEVPVDPDLVLVAAVSITGTALACGLLGLAVWLARRRSRPVAAGSGPEPSPRPVEVLVAPTADEPGPDGAQDATGAAVTRPDPEVLASLRRQRDELATIRHDLVALLDGREDLHRLVQETRTDVEKRTAALRQHLDDVAAYLDHRLPDGGPVRERFALPDRAGSTPAGGPV